MQHLVLENTHAEWQDITHSSWQASAGIKVQSSLDSCWACSLWALDGEQAGSHPCTNQSDVGLNVDLS